MQLVTSGQTLRVLPNPLFMDLDSTTVFSDFVTGKGASSGSASIAVLFSDVSNGGAMTSVLLQVTSVGSLVRVSPFFVLNSGNPALETVYTWGAIAPGQSESLYNSQFVALSVLSNIDCSIGNQPVR